MGPDTPRIAVVKLQPTSAPLPITVQLGQSAVTSYGTCLTESGPRLGTETGNLHSPIMQSTTFILAWAQKTWNPHSPIMQFHKVHASAAGSSPNVCRKMGSTTCDPMSWDIQCAGKTLFTHQKPRRHARPATRGAVPFPHHSFLAVISSPSMPRLAKHPLFEPAGIFQ